MKNLKSGGQGSGLSDKQVKTGADLEKRGISSSNLQNVLQAAPKPTTGSGKQASASHGNMGGERRK
ncbi:hypothetical protein [Allomesorhizobium camelthorni]|uniref:Uncharacterized protein n=1 Tax=Allomesorhizobium camelthorni TaxID=475069 RepID=A0A6G4WIY7_9HYPH|nr:hypothetical protein [Mesorhizobium camelthorni]NGO54574.1 hypothetical protein [Mesorhizobium camelthorni]